jgi:putative endonuclease
MKTTKEIGDFGERRAVNYLRWRGYTVKERNYRTGHYEIDIIAQRWNEIAFVEVKTRTYKIEDIENAPPPGNAVKKEKQLFTRRAAQQYLYETKSKKRPRMDVIEVWLVDSPDRKRPKIWKIRHLKGVY